MVIVTQGPDSIITILGKKVRVFDVPPVKNIVDTNGAGDAFCGGIIFLINYLWRNIHLKKNFSLKAFLLNMFVVANLKSVLNAEYIVLLLLFNIKDVLFRQNAIIN